MGNINTVQEAYRVGAALKMAEDAGLLSDSTSPTSVTAADTVAGIQAAIAAGTLARGMSEVVRTQISRAVRVGEDLGILTDALINPLTTVDGLIALTGVPTDYKRRAFYD